MWTRALSAPSPYPAYISRYWTTAPGLDVTTNNITWCAPEMYVNALATAGITDAKVIVAAPFDVSGTAALTGVYKAYEDITGQKLDENAKLVPAHRSWRVTSDLANEIGSYDSTSIVTI
jgi:uncharacterized protein YpuA (DUF1002 family)